VFAKFEEKYTMNVIKPFLFALAVFAGGPAALAEQHWVATWATAPATSFVYVPPVAPAPPGPPTTFAPANIQPDLAFPFPTASTLGATEQTFRSIVKPDLWGKRMRFRFSNVFGSQSVTFDEVTVALQSLRRHNDLRARYQRRRPGRQRAGARRQPEGP
jgi:hypothetical protein